jgi:hypothetical protein
MEGTVASSSANVLREIKYMTKEQFGLVIILYVLDISLAVTADFQKNSPSWYWTGYRNERLTQRYFQSVLRVSLVAFKSWLNGTAGLMQIGKNKSKVQLSNYAEKTNP